MLAKPSHKNIRLALSLIGIVCIMVGLAFASVPLYRWFCQVTGYGGTTQVAEQAPALVSDRIITIRFNADIDRQLPWRFAPEILEMPIHLGETGQAFYSAENLTERLTKGSATFNVTPAKAGLYFNKIECFCFTEQTLNPGESARLGVTFFVDPTIVDDPDLQGLDTITLSYTFFNTLEEPLEEKPDHGAEDHGSHESKKQSP